MPTPASILKNTFGYDAFRPLQKEVIENVLARRDTLAIMPTGGGKSLCYQIPALLFPGLTVVVSPLIALMKDQVEQLRANGVPAVFLNSTLSPEVYQENMEYIRRGEVKLLYAAPETLLTPRIFGLLDEVKVDLLTIDEAHCISEWGHDFRPEYRQLVGMRRRYPGAVCLAMTATATPRVQADIKATLGFAGSDQFVASFNRENLYLEVSPKRDALKQTLRFLERHADQSGIIYCFSRKQVDDLAADLARRGYAARPYHAGLMDEERKANQELFIRDDAQIIVATIAFGMGINKPNVRFVLHYDLPKSIEGYYQEIGRAGRDGLPAHCLLLYSYADAAKQRYFVEQKTGEERRVASQHLDAMVRYAEDEVTCRRKTLLGYFGEIYPSHRCGNCDHCKGAPPTFIDITIPAQKFLSCVKRTGERFPAGHVVAVLRGSKDAAVLAHQHEQLSTYGIGVDLSETVWRALARQLVQMGYLNQDGDDGPLSLTDQALEALRKRKPILGSALPEPKEKVGERRRVRAAKAAQPAPECNSALYALLRQKRKQLADWAGLPPHVIFSDQTLVEMAAYYPQSMERLLDISGVGQVKLHQYGEAFLEVLRPFCQKHGLAERVKSQGDASQAARRKSDAGRRYVSVGRAYHAGQSISALMEYYQVPAATIRKDLVRYASAGNALRCGDDLRGLVSAAPEEQRAAFAAFDELGADFLNLIYDTLGGKIAIDELKLLRLIYLAAHQPPKSAEIPTAAKG